LLLLCLKSLSISRPSSIRLNHEEKLSVIMKTYVFLAKTYVYNWRPSSTTQ
jgi:hypothetical protein